MNLEKILQFQQELDNKIESKNHLEGKSLLTKKLLSFQVKVGELATETQCFKYWLTKKSLDRQAILNKYMECTQFLLAVGLDKGFTQNKVNLKSVEYDLIEQFANLYIDINDFMVCSSKDNYISLLEDFLSLSPSLGLTEKEIEDGYRDIYL